MAAVTCGLVIIVLTRFFILCHQIWFMEGNYTLFILLALVAEILGTISGFGSSILFVPVASLFFDFKTVLGVTAVFHVFSNLSKILLFKKGIDKTIVLWLGIPAVVMVVVGALITTRIQMQQAALMMNITLVILSIYLLANIGKSVKRTHTNLVAGGAVSGLLAGLTGTGGAVRGIVMTAFNLPKDVFIATSAMIDLGVDLSRSVVYVSNGYFPRSLIIIVPLLILVGLVGSYIGKLLLAYTSEKSFRYIAVTLIVITSIIEVGRHFTK